MAHSTIALEKNGVYRLAPIGFSWTTLCFGFFPALLRGHVGIALVQLFLQLLSVGLSIIIFAFIYNKMYVNYLLENGYRFKQVVSGGSKSQIEASLGFSLPSVAPQSNQDSSSLPKSRSLEEDSYKLFLSGKYSIKRNDVFEKYVCADSMFDTLEDALKYADVLESAKINEPETEEEISYPTPKYGPVLLGIGFILLIPVTVLATLGYLGYLPSEGEDSASRIEAAVAQLELDAAAARQKAEELAASAEPPDSYSSDLGPYDSVYHEIERPLVVSIPNSTKVMQFKVAVRTLRERTVDDMEKHQYAIRSEILDVMRKIDETQISEPNFRSNLAEQLKIAVNSVLEKYEDYLGVEEVMFTEFIIQ